MVVFGQMWMYSDKNSCNWPRVFVFGQSGCIGTKVVVFDPKWLFSNKVVVFG